jgi:hypothetical protein
MKDFLYRRWRQRFFSKTFVPVYQTTRCHVLQRRNIVDNNFEYFDSEAIFMENQ